MKLIKTEIDALECPPGKRDRMVFDDALPGFGVRVTMDGLKVFLFQYRIGKTVRRLRLGRYGDLTPTQARKLAEAARLQVSAGNDPMGARKASAVALQLAKVKDDEAADLDAFTFNKLIDAWDAERLAHRRPSYRREALRALRLNLAALLTVPAHAVTANMLRQELGLITTRTRRAIGAMPKGPPPTQGAPGVTIRKRVRAYAHAVFAWGERQELVPSNPASAVHVEFRAVARERVLSDTEIGEVWRATDALGWPWGPFFRFLILTLQRETETAGLRWFELSSDLARWEIAGARTKNRRAHIVHLVPEARAIINAAPRLTMPPDLTPSPFVFTTTGKAPVSGFSHAKSRLDNEILSNRIKAAAALGKPAEPLEPWRIHDLRRTGVTVMARRGVRYEVADRVLNHVGGAIQGVVAIYQRHEYLAEREAALTLWADHVQAVARH